MTIKVKDVTETYGGLNDIGNDPTTPIGDRRLTAPKAALQRTLEQLHTPDALAGKNQFRGLVLATLPSRLPRRVSKTAHFESMDVLNGTANQRIDPQMAWYYYKVYVPEIDPRCMDLAKPSDKLLQQVLSLDDTFMSINLIEQGMNKKIATGTLVTVRYEDPRRALGAEIVEIGPLIFPYDITGIQGQDSFPFGGDISLLGSSATSGDHPYPAGGTGASNAAMATNALPKQTPADVLACAKKYDETPAAGGGWRAENDIKLNILHAEFKPYAKCYIYRLHDELGAKVKLNSTFRSNTWQSNHRYWWLTEARNSKGRLKQDILAAAAWGNPKQTVPESRKRNKTWKCNSCGSWHLVGWAIDHNVKIKSGAFLSTRSTKADWTNSGVVAIGQSIGLWWGVTKTRTSKKSGSGLWDPIHWGGQNILKKMIANMEGGAPFSCRGSGGASQYATRQGVAWNKFTL